MANLLFTYEPARRAGPIGVTANAIHPGLERTALVRRPRTAAVATRLASRRPETVAATIVPVILSGNHADTTGQLLKDGTPAATNDYPHDPAHQARLWDDSSALAGLTETI
jgi:NAD(P)-dependent dehydrogenase (short-subunit alcohol dehydrogenase family)